MLTKLKSLQTVDIKKTEKEKLKDINNINICTDEPPIQRLIKFMSVMENPYIFRAGKTPVKLTFLHRHQVILQKSMENIVSSKTR